MRIRIKYSKTGILKYIGHLDTMRFFQKALRRAGFNVVYSEGFNPHMVMSFALPLGVGVTSEGEYFDLDVKTADSSEVMTEKLNKQMPDGMRILNVVKIGEDKASKCMTQVAGADYELAFENMEMLCVDWKNLFEEFMGKSEIFVVKKTKKNENTIDIRPLIYSYDIKDGGICFRLSAGSVNNLKPQLVMNAFCEDAGLDHSILKYRIHRKNLLLEKEGKLYPLDHLGEQII